jgi:hypothetical protein
MKVTNIAEYIAAKNELRSLRTRVVNNKFEVEYKGNWILLTEAEKIINPNGKLKHVHNEKGDLIGKNYLN